MVLVDCVGPLPRTKSGNQYLLTSMDLATRYPEAVPLKRITAKQVIESLILFFTRHGLPREIQSDQGSNFMSGLFQQVMRELGIHQVTSSAYHPESQGALERFHQTLKTMLRAYCLDRPEDWDKGIPFVLFAIRDVPNESTGFSPFELVYGHQVRGPLKFLKEKLLSPHQEDDPNLLEYVSSVRERLSGACALAREHLKTAQHVMKTHFDLKAKEREFVPGDKVLALLPVPQDPLSAKFHGPYRIIKKLNDVDYVISTPDRRKSRRVCHINMLKEYHDRDSVPVAAVSPVVHMLDENGTDCEETDQADSPDWEEVASPVRLCNSDVLKKLDAEFQHLSANQGEALKELIHEFDPLFADVPGRTTLTVHDVEVVGSEPIKQHPYRLNPEKRAKVREEVQYMLEHDLIEPSQSAWSSPVVLMPKPDGGQRLCIDLRKVNSVHKSDSHPIPRLVDCIDQVGRAKYMTKIDLLKGYWQVPLSDKAKEISAFVTPDGLYQCKVMPFGMKGAPATFQRLMNQVISGLPNCVAYIDDVLVFSDTWEEHLQHLRDLFTRLREANLVINLKKTVFAKATVTYLGHVVGQGQVLPDKAKVQAIVEFPAPKSKRELLRFLGLSGFYRNFCTNLGTVAAPLTDLLKSKVKFLWTEACEQAFRKLKAILANEPVLKAPDFAKAFKLAVDASDVGVGAVLLQDDTTGVE